MGAEQLDFTGGGFDPSPEAVEAMISRMCHFVAAKDAEIAKLKNELTKAQQDGYAEGRKHRVAAVETHADEMHRAQEEIAKLRAEVEANYKDYGMIRDRYDATAIELLEARADLARLRAIEAAAVDLADAESAIDLSRCVEPDADRSLLFSDLWAARASLIKAVKP